jgi:ketosteroid isomerase-like protein
MSQENVGIGYRVVAAWNARDVEAILALTDPEVEYVNSPASVEPGTRWGHEGLVEVYRAQWEVLSDGRWEVDRVYDRHDEVIGLGRISRRMPGSNARIEERILATIRFKDGRITRTEVLGFGQAEVREALKAVGLSE